MTGSLRGLLIWWIIGNGIIVILLYVIVLQYYLCLGIHMKTELDFEQYALIHEKNHAVNRDSPLPAGPGLTSYRSVEDMPAGLRTIFPDESHEHARMQVHEVDDDNPTAGQLGLDCDHDPLHELIFFYSYRLNDKDWLYMSQIIVPTEQVSRHNVVLYISLTILLLFTILALLLIRKIGNPIRQLAAWADKLTTQKPTEDTPDFQYRELNLVAARLASAFDRISQSVEKERRFLQHASHELRTPIAVASGNLELLEKLGTHEKHNKDETAALARLEHAIRDMHQLTETLLRLNHDSNPLPPRTSIDLKTLLNELIASNEYLLANKHIQVDVVGADMKIDAPLTPCRIILSNLIRNAFQYTHEGWILITVLANGVSIHNRNKEAIPEADTDSKPTGDHGFGLGLDLVEQITWRLGWRYEHEVRDNGRLSTIFFDTCRKS